MALTSQQITTYLQVAQVSGYLMDNNNRQNLLFDWGNLKGVYKDSNLVHILQNNLTWANNNGFSQTVGFTKSILYMVALIGKYYNQSLGVVNNMFPTTTVTSSPTGFQIPIPINITITAGQSGVKTISNSNWINLTGINQIVINQAVFQVGTGFIYVPATGTFDFTPSNYTLQTNDVLTTLGFKSIS